MFFAFFIIVRSGTFLKSFFFFFSNLQSKNIRVWKKELSVFYERNSSGKNETVFLMTDLNSLEWKSKFERELSELGFNVMFADELSNQLYHKVRLSSLVSVIVYTFVFTLSNQKGKFNGVKWRTRIADKSTLYGGS